MSTSGEWAFLGAVAAAGAAVWHMIVGVGGWIGDRARRDTKAKAVDEKHQTTLNDHENRLRDLEKQVANDLAELKRDVHYIRKALEQRN